MQFLYMKLTIQYYVSFIGFSDKKINFFKVPILLVFNYENGTLVFLLSDFPGSDHFREIRNLSGLN